MIPGVSAMILGGRIKSHPTDDGRPMDGRCATAPGRERGVARANDRYINQPESRPRVIFVSLNIYKVGGRSRVDRFISRFPPRVRRALAKGSLFSFASALSPLPRARRYRVPPRALLPHRVYAAFCSFSRTMCLAVGAVRTRAVH